ncbi:hypothetical protein CTAYLR_005841 [Chrysophaeum taylorii]|uniref:Phospholipid/glycerol acyltransferase domain-containing protein n=1 Tax=Chrysophaeum taylorii TaxID=2483200 RepID=A0AAD7XUJ4_9STRA|nr:hypothetical protein CTAYLR_005841 [Chrysophaeum taylorii]
MRGAPKQQTLETRDWLGRGGLMGLPWIAFPSHLAGMMMRVRVYAMSALWLLIAVQYFAWQLPLTVLLLVPDCGAAYKRASTWFDRLAQPAILAVPYSWCGLRVHTSQYALMTSMAARGNALVMTNHCSRIDWIVGMLLGHVLTPKIRIGFVAEITTMLMPVFGWSRLLFGDVFLRRAFHRDGARIRANVSSFHEAGVDRMMFVAPEGAIVDPGVPKDEDYVKQCRAFARALGREGLKFLLTPRYKGIQLLALHAPDAVFSVTMTFRCRSTVGPKRDVEIDASGKATGGELCTRALDDPRRVVPDLHTIFRGGLHVFCHIHRLHLSPEASSAKVRDSLIADYERKDRLLATFERHGKFDHTDAAYVMSALPIAHARMNFALLVHSALSAYVVSCFGVDASSLASGLFMAWVVVSLLHAVTHLYAERISGASRESLIFETLLKTLIEFTAGKLDHGSSSSSSSSSSFAKLM